MSGSIEKGSHSGDDNDSDKNIDTSADSGKKRGWSGVREKSGDQNDAAGAEIRKIYKGKYPGFLTPGLATDFTTPLTVEPAG